MSSVAIQLNNKHFRVAVQKVLKENPQVEEVIETGTHKGTGSTQVWASTGLPVKTIEVSPWYHREAKQNLKDFDNVQLFLGSSLSVSEMEEFIKENEEYYHSAKKRGIACEPSPVDFYLSEVNGLGAEEKVASPIDWLLESPPQPKTRQFEAENLLSDFINNTKNQLIFLDSAGGVGFLEYQKVIQMPSKFLKKKILFLDDINHVKHERSVSDLEGRGYEVVRSGDDRSCYCVL